MSPSPTALPASPLRLAAVQGEAVPGEIAHNARRAAALAARAAEEGARLVLFPELHLCGYDLGTLARQPGRSETPADARGHVTDGRVGPLTTAAEEHGVTVLAGAAVRREGGPLTNSVLRFAPDGSVTAVYDKQHLWQDEEKDLFTAGRGGTVLSAWGWRLGLGLCYDMSFPEHAREAALSGAHAYLCLSAFASGAEHRAFVYLAARALENTVHSVFVNPVGGPAHRPCDGGTAVFGPDGSTVCRAEEDRETVLHARLDPAETARVRGFLHMLAERRDEARPGAVPPGAAASTGALNGTPRC